MDESEPKVCRKSLVIKSIKKAVKHFERNQYNMCCLQFCIAFKLSPNNQLSNKWKSTFLFAFDRHINQLEQIADNHTIIKAFDEAIDAIPQCEDLLYSKGIYYYKKGYLSKAVTCFRSSLELNPNFNLSHLCIENIKASSIARWHFIMINDINRNTAFRNAIIISVAKGYKNVLDIGSGSGLLSLYALEAGAEKVYACEVSEMLCHMCKDVFESNQVIDKVILFNEMSTNISIPQTIDKPVNLVFTEIFDAALFGEHVLTTIHSALKNLLDSNHRMVIPNKATVYGVLIESQELRQSFTLTTNKFGNIDISDDVLVSVDFDDVKYTTTDLYKIKDKKYLSQIFQIINIDFNDIHQIEKLLADDYELNLNIKCDNSGKLDVIGIWFELNLIDDIVISTKPPSDLIGWEQAIYPSSVRRFTVNNESEVSLKFKFNEDYMKLCEIKLLENSNQENELKINKFSSDVIKYLNSHHLHNTYMTAINKILNNQSIRKVIDMTYFPVSSLNFAQKNVSIIDENELNDKIDSFLTDIGINLFDNKSEIISFEQFIQTNMSVKNCLVITDLIESSGLMRSNMLEKFAYLNIYTLDHPIFIPYKIIIKAKLIQSEDLIIRSRLVSDENVHGYKIKEFLNIFETEILQNIDIRKTEKIDLSNDFDLLEINLNQFYASDEQINIEPNNECAVKSKTSGQLHAVLYWYELHLTDDIILSSLDLGANWHTAAFIIKKPIDLKINEQINIRCVFTNGFLRLELSNDLCE